MRPKAPNALPLTIGLGASDGIDFFWGDNYRWERWVTEPRALIALCEAVRAGDAIEETWRVAGMLLGKRSYLRPNEERVGDGSPPLPAWLLRFASHSIHTFRPWGEAV